MSFLCVHETQITVIRNHSNGPKRMFIVFDSALSVRHVDGYSYDETIKVSKQKKVKTLKPKNAFGMTKKTHNRKKNKHFIILS